MLIVDIRLVNAGRCFFQITILSRNFTSAITFRATSGDANIVISSRLRVGFLINAHGDTLDAMPEP